jgi:hypothetical protein
MIAIATVKRSKLMKVEPKNYAMMPFTSLGRDWNYRYRMY